MPNQPAISQLPEICGTCLYCTENTFPCALNIHNRLVCTYKGRYSYSQRWLFFLK